MSVLLTAGSPTTTASERRESTMNRLLHSPQAASSSSPAGLWQCPAGHRLREPLLTLSLLPPSQGLDWKPQGSRPGASLWVKQWLKLLPCREKWESSCHHEEQRDHFLPHDTRRR